MENRVVCCETERNESRSFSSATIRMTVGHVAGTAISNRRRQALHVFVRQAAVSAFAIILLTAPLYAQKGPSPSGTGGSDGSNGANPTARSVFSGGFPL